MHIAIDVRPLIHKERTGVGEYTKELLQALFEHHPEHEYYLCYNSYKDVSEYFPSWEYPHVHMILSRWPNKLFHAFLWLGIVSFDRFFVHRTSLQTFDILLFPNIHFTHVSKKTPFLQIIHDLSFVTHRYTYSFKRQVWHRLLRIPHLCRRAAAVIVPSHHTKQDCIRVWHVPEEQVHVAFPGVSSFGQYATPTKEDIDSVRKTYSIGERYLLSLSTLEPRKNIQMTLDAFRLSRSFEKGYELVIAGARGWNDATILKKIKETPGVKYLGYIREQDKPALYAGATIFLYPSLYEGFGLPVLEAFFLGTPVITSDRSSLPEVSNGIAYSVHPENVTSLVIGMRRLLGNKELRDWMSKKGKIRAAQFSWEDTAHSIESLCIHYAHRN